MDIRDDEELGMYYRRVYQEKGFVAMLKAMGKGCFIYIIVLPLIILLGVGISSAWESLFGFDKEATIECIQDGPWLYKRNGDTKRRLIFSKTGIYLSYSRNGKLFTSGYWKVTDVGIISVTYDYCRGGCDNIKGTTFTMPDCGEVRAGSLDVYTRSGW